MNISNGIKRLLIIGLFTLFLTLAIPVSAAVFETGDEYALPEGEVLKQDLYVSGGSIVTAGAVEGDIMAVGGKVLIQGLVTGDVFAVGGNIDVLGGVTDDVRLVGGQIAIQGVVGGDVLVGGGQIHILENTVIKGDIVTAGGRVVIDGRVEGNVRAYGGDIALNGEVLGNFETFADNAFTFGPRASIGGNLTYRSPVELELPRGAVLGEVIYEPHNIRFDKVLLSAILSVAFFLKTLMLVVASLLLVAFFRQFSLNVVHYGVPHFGKALLIGFVLLIIIPVISILLFVSFIGTFVGLAFILLYALSLVVAKICAGILAGALLSKWIKKEVKVDPVWVILGVLAIQFLALVPVVGWAGTMIFTLAALGSLASLAHSRFWLTR